MLSRSYCFHQALVCLSLAHRTNEEGLKRRLEELAMDFVGRVGTKDDMDIAPLPTVTSRKPDSSDR